MLPTFAQKDNMQRNIHSDLWDAGYNLFVTINEIGYIKAEFTPQLGYINSDEVAEMLAVLRSTSGIQAWKWVVEAVSVNFAVLTFRSLDHMPRG